MRVLQVVAIFLAAAVSAQQAGVCDVKDDDCADVINPNACYNQFRFNAQTLQCIDGKDNADRARKVRSHPLPPLPPHTPQRAPPGH